MKIFTAFPAYGRTNMTDTTCSLVKLSAFLAFNGLFGGFGTASHTDIGELRNVFLTTFFDKTDASHILFIDADMSFEPSLIADMLKVSNGVVGVVYPKKNGNGEWVGRPLPGVQSPMNGFMEMAGVGGGILLISRECVASLLEKIPEMEDDSPMERNRLSSCTQGLDLSRIIHAFDRVKDESGLLLSEDLSFCQRWRQVGGKVLANISHDVGHVGIWEFSGNYNEKLLSASTERQSAA